MIRKQKQTLESFVRVRAFLEAHPLTGTLSYTGAQETLDVVRRLREYAGAQVEPESDVRMSASIRMQHNGLGVTRILQASDGLIKAARPFEATFIAHGLPADFLARFTAARWDASTRWCARRSATTICRSNSFRAGLSPDAPSA